MRFPVFRVVTLSLAIVGLVAAGTAIVILSDYRATSAYNGRVAAGIGRVVEVNLRRLIQNAEVALGQTIDMAAANGGIAALTEPDNWAVARAFLDPVIGGQELWVVDRTGRLTMLSTAVTPPAVSVADRAYFAAARHDTALFVGPAIRSKISGETSLTFSRGILDGGGAFDGVVGIDIAADWLLAFYALLESELAPDIGVFRGDGQVVLVNRDLDAMVGRRAQDSPHWRDLFAGNAPDRGLASRLVIDAYDLVVIVRLDPGRALARWQARTINTAVVAALGAVTLIVFFLLVVRMMERQRATAVQLAEATTRLATARHDALTGLAGRALFRDRARDLLGLAARNGQAVGMLYLDLDGFKQVNDRLGHDRGDEVLIATARGIAGAVRDVDIAARLGGDEFVVCLVAPPEAVAATLREIADRILAQVGTIGDGIACSIGTTWAAGGRADLDDLLRRADQAMRRAKAAGKNRVVSG